MFVALADNSFFLTAAHVAMVMERKPLERNMVGVVAMEEARQMVGRRGATFKADSHQKEKTWLTLTESCASDITEAEEQKPMRAPPGMSDPIGGGK